MFQKNKISIYLLIIVNLSPLFGVLFFNWSLFPIMALYWSENVVIGFFTILKIFQANKGSRNLKSNVAFSVLGNIIVKIFLISFFIVHFGLFTLAHGAFVFALFYDNSFSLKGLLIPIILLFLSHGASYVVNYIGKKEYKKTNVAILFISPYKRVFILHITIILGGIFSYLLHVPTFSLIVLIFLKISIDLITHHLEHKKFIKLNYSNEKTFKSREQAK